ncbi:hypothetical protein D9758_012847 [Tetrapyrgos nigripes]|uniref:Uncharacterized protein n=1 Tax=Tetrapyrgos nigripes TaxID=182062 RepID=A0A8H5CBT9_9AGAR|nr:hypothetical protein D9758_012847 [Tetrapyrgos nigripes]
MMENSGCKLQSLFLDGVQISSEDLYALLCVTPDLTRLTFHEHGDEDVETDIGTTLLSYLTWLVPTESVNCVHFDHATPLTCHGVRLPKLIDVKLKTRSFLDHTLMKATCDLLESRTALSSQESLTPGPLSLQADISAIREFQFQPLLSASADILNGTDPARHRFEELAQQPSPSYRKVFHLVLPDASDTGDFDDELDSDPETSNRYTYEPPEEPYTYESLTSALNAEEWIGIRTNDPNYPTGADLLLGVYCLNSHIREE